MYKPAIRSAAILGALCCSSAFAQQAIGITAQQALAFGSFAAGGGGTVTIAANGSRSTSGLVYALSSGPGREAQFAVTGDPNVSFSITLPADGTVSLTSDSGASMSVIQFTSAPAAAGQLTPGGTQTVTVGATLQVSANQAPGAYAGSFTVTVNYN